MLQRKEEEKIAGNDTATRVARGEQKRLARENKNRAQWFVGVRIGERISKNQTSITLHNICLYRLTGFRIDFFFFFLLENDSL